ncbi:ryncolin-4-like [Magallana gigas]|uniref:ryncolin-4-like n=1 Tax=Magallana gigas TaxID=29159 RepID=UPI003341BF43
MSEMKIGFFFILQIGNDVIHHLTNRQPHAMCVISELNIGSIFHQKYDHVSIGNKSTNYQLHLAVPNTGNLGDSMINTGNSNTNLNGASFSTVDRDNDQWKDVHCVALFNGGWWFNDCLNAFLNGPWPPENWMVSDLKKCQQHSGSQNYD